MVAAVLAGGCGTTSETFGVGSAGRKAPTVRFVIPAGTGASIDAGKKVEILPRRLNVKVGDVLEIDNRDARGFLIGPFFVGKGERVRQEFVRPGTFVGDCAVHPSGRIEIVVT